MIEQLKNVMVETGASWVLWLLFALSVGLFAVALDRTRVFWHERADVDSLVRDLNRLLARGELEPAERRLASSRGTAARVVLAGLVEVRRGATATAEAMAAATGREKARLERRLLFLGTVGNNAPFIGLLGTVIGIVGAFDELGRSGALAPASRLAPERVMSTIAEALVATAVGLVVAIPAVLLFNYFHGLLGATLADAETLGHVLLTHVEKAKEGSRIASGERHVGDGRG
jgi:biopolymer transport protein ExbB